MPLLRQAFSTQLGDDVTRHDATCNDCYFRRAGLCALATEKPCPTFRSHTRGALTPPPQAQLVARPLRRLALQTAA